MAKSKFKKCETRYCRGVATKSGRSPYCAKCRSSRWRAKHPITAHFHDLRNRAKQRGHEFTLTLADYEQFWHSSGYAEKHGKTAASLSIDRIDPSKGYIPGNVRAITLSENSRRQFVPYFKNKAQEEAAIAEAQAHVSEALKNTTLEEMIA